MPATPAGTRRPKGGAGTAARQPTARGARLDAAPDRRTRRLVVVGAVVAAAMFTIGGVLLASRGSGSVTPTATTSAPNLTAVSGRGRAVAPPWATPADPQARARAAGLSMGQMGRAEHYHPRLSIVVDGHKVEVPANLGVDPDTGLMSAVHTHTSDGVIHIEAARSGQVFTLGQLFTEWDVALGPAQLGALHERGTLTVTVNGKPYPGNPALLRLAPDQRITVDYATIR